MRREERVTVQGPVKKHQPDGMSHRGTHKHSAHPPVWSPISKPPPMHKWCGSPWFPSLFVKLPYVCLPSDVVCSLV